MAAKSPVRTREIIGGDQFSQRREVFDKHNTVFLPASPTNLSSSYKEVEPIVTSNHGKTTVNFKRNSPGYSSMRESRDERDHVEFRQRKYSDNYTSELNKSDDADYRQTMTERTRRLTRMRKEFLTSNLHEVGDISPFTRTAGRSSLPARSGSIKYKTDSPTIYKFPFAEPYSTPTPVRKLNFDLDSAEGDEVKNNKENHDPDKQVNFISNESNKKLFEELLKRYSPNRKPVDWTLPPTRPRVVSTLPKANTDKTDSGKRAVSGTISDMQKQTIGDAKSAVPNKTGVKNGDSSRHIPETEQSTDSQVSLTELAEKNDRVPELTVIQRQISRDAKRPSLSDKNDLNIPALIDKMNAEGNDLESHKNDKKKVKRKRSFIDKLLGRKKETAQQQ